MLFYHILGKNPYKKFISDIEQISQYSKPNNRMFQQFLFENKKNN